MFKRLSIPFLAIYNIVDYPLRQFFRWRRAGFKNRNEPKDQLYARIPSADRPRIEAEAECLRQAYHLNQFYNDSSADNYRENLYYLSLLESALSAAAVELPAAIAAADIGPSDWFYVQAYHAALQWWRSPNGRRVSLSGYERDAYRVYATFHSRYDHALAHIRGLDGVTYISQAFHKQPAQYDVITMLFPFVFLMDHLEWGLTHNSFDPRRLLSDVWDSLKPGGLLIVANQGEKEHNTQRELFQMLGIKPGAMFQFESSLYEYDLPRFIITAQHDD